MLAAPSRDWHVFQPIFAEPWAGVTHAHPRAQTASSDGLVAKRLAGGNPATMGSIAYRCRPWGQGQHLVARRGQASLGVRCAQGSGDHGGSQGSQRRHEGGISRHLIRTVPAMVRTTFAHNTAVLVRALRRCGVRGLADVLSAGRGKARKGGALVGLHTPGRHGPSPPHRPLIATRGGEEGQGARWEPGEDLPYELLRRQGPWPLLTLLRQTLKSDAIHRWGEGCCRPSPHGLGPNGHKGKGPAPSQSVARAVAQDVVSPPSAVRRRER